MSLRRSVLALVPLAVFLACGGKVQGSGDGQCPLPQTIAQGGSCEATLGIPCASSFDMCATGGSAPGSVDCMCVGGTWDCTGGAACEAMTCPAPASIADGAACNVAPTVSCPSAETLRDCDGGVLATIDCRCAGGAWACARTGGPVCAVEAGPDAEPDADAGPETSTGCPPAETLVQGIACSEQGLLCPGHPTSCNGLVDYDAFECQAGQWIDVARTYCLRDAGQID